MSPTALEKAIEGSAAPHVSQVAIDRLLEARPELRERLARHGPTRDAIVAVTSASRHLTTLLLTDPDAIGVLDSLGNRRPVPASGVDELVRWKSLELLRIAVRDLLGLDSLERVGSALSRMASDVLEAACRFAGDAASGLAVIGMGKLGAHELNYASDVDVVFVGEGDARSIIDVSRQCFRVDADLRPEGRDGPLARTLASYEAYWDRWAEPWEFQALIKARPVAGNRQLGEEFGKAASGRLWSRPFGAEELRSVRAMKARAEAEVQRKGLSDREVKLGRGGIRDIEFAVQLLQLVHARHDPVLRQPATLAALSELAAAGYVDAADAASLDAAYRFLRNVEHRLQLVDGQQVHAIPTDPAARTRVARVMGYRDDRNVPAVDLFEADLRRHQATARSIHERLYFRPLLEAFAGGEVSISAEAIEQRLAAFGFADVERTRQAVTELTRGLTRSSRMMHQLLPLLLGWLSESPDPDLGLLGLRTLASGTHRTALLVEAFRESSEIARRLCLLLGTGRSFQRGLEQHPDLIPLLDDPDWLEVRARTNLLDQASASLGWRGGVEARRGALLRLKRVEELKLAARDVLGLDGVEATGAGLTTLAETVVEAALEALDPPVPMAVVAMGRFGGAELSYASDLDVLLVYDGTSTDDAARADATAQLLFNIVKGTTPATRIWRLDADLRPEGRQGPLARSLDGYRVYYERWAQTWERQALVRARPVAGDQDVGERFMALVDPFVWRELTEAEAREIRRMKARIERERIPSDEDPQFHLKLGRGSLSDIEWTAQLLQLRHGVRSTGTVTALEALTRAGALSAADADVLAESYRFCERTRNRLYLVRGAAGDALPAQAEQLSRLARSLGMSGPELRDSYRRATRRARAVVERLFYGKPV